MSKDFNLLDEPWLPVRYAGGDVEHLGLLETFRRSSQIEAIAETEPPSLVAQYRLLLAILHRALTRAFPDGWKDWDRARWYEDGLPVDAVVDYLGHWRDRFWLFHPDHPFMQVAVLAEAGETRDKMKPWTQIAIANATGNTPVVFDHSLDTQPVPATPADVVASLLGFLQFTPGGLVKVLRTSDKSGPLMNTAAVLPVGRTLAQTLTLSLHGPNRDDLPAWERASLTIAKLSAAASLATGPNDRYTRQSRAVLLRKDPDGLIRQLHFAVGLALEEDSNAPDPMACFRAGSSGLVRLGFREARSLWRDLPALAPNPAGTSQPPAVLEYAMALHGERTPFDTPYQPLLVAGVASDQAKILRWRSESVVLPLALLEDPERAQYLRELVEKAEAFFSGCRRLFTAMLGETLPDPAHRETRSRARQLFEVGPFPSIYFAMAERALPEVMRLLAEGDYAGATHHWDGALRRSALAAWSDAVTGLGKSTRALRAEARAWPRFHDLLAQHVPAADTSTTVEEA